MAKTPVRHFRCDDETWKRWGRLVKEYKLDSRTELIHKGVEKFIEDFEKQIKKAMERS